VSIWAGVINFVRTRYEVLEERDGWLRFQVAMDGDRGQQVSVHHLPDHEGAEWVEISSPVGWADKIDLRRLLELAGGTAVGGAAVVDGVALLKHTVPLVDMNLQAEFEEPLKALVARADDFERQLTKADEF
jgi:hypothetical protein